MVQILVSTVLLIFRPANLCIGVVFLRPSPEPLYPIIVFEKRDTGMHIRANFGRLPFQHIPRSNVRPCPHNYAHLRRGGHPQAYRLPSISSANGFPYGKHGQCPSDEGQDGFLASRNVALASQAYDNQLLSKLGKPQTSTSNIRGDVKPPLTTSNHSMNERRTFPMQSSPTGPLPFLSTVQASDPPIANLPLLSVDEEFSPPLSPPRYTEEWRRHDSSSSRTRHEPVEESSDDFSGTVQGNNGRTSSGFRLSAQSAVDNDVIREPDVEGSVRKASETRERRTDRSLRMTEQDTGDEDIYVKEDDDLPKEYPRLESHLQISSAENNRRLSAYLTNHVAMRSALDQAMTNSYAQQYPDAPSSSPPAIHVYDFNGSHGQDRSSSPSLMNPFSKAQRPMTIPDSRADSPPPPLPPARFIDEIVRRKWARLGLACPAEPRKGSAEPRV